MKFKDLASMTSQDRDKKLVEIKKELLKLNGQVVTGTVPKSPGQIRQLKTDMAKITAINAGIKKKENGGV